MEWSAAILVGGDARRFGGIDKSALLVGGRSILERQLAALREAAASILIVARHEVRYRRTGERVVCDRIAGAGSLGALYTALVESPTERIIVLAGDMPFLTARFLERLAAIGADAEAAIPFDARGAHPLCASYHVRVADSLKTRIEAGALRVQDAIARLDVRRIGPGELAPFDPEGLLLLNVNTPEDYARACEAAQTAQPPA